MNEKLSRIVIVDTNFACEISSKRTFDQNCCDMEQLTVIEPTEIIKASDDDGDEVDETENEPLKIDPFQRAMGSLGRWHIFICGFIFLTKFPYAWNQLSIIFMAPNIEFTCADPNIANKCSENCTSYQYDREVFTETIQMTWDLVCEKVQFSNLSQTFVAFGILVGGMIFGTLSDKFGRRGPLVLAVFIQLIAGIGTAFAPWFWLYCFLRFLAASATGGALVISIVLITELVGTKWRDVVIVLYQIPFNLGHLTMPLFAYYFRNWRHFQLALSIPTAAMITYYWIIPESPRWLFSAGRIRDTEAVLKKAAVFNGRSTELIRSNLETLASNTTSAAKDASRGNYIDLVRIPKMRINTISMCFIWLVVGICFYGVAQYIGQSSGDIFLNVAISAALGLPGTIICLFTTRTIGRKFTMVASNVITGVCMILIIFLPSYQVSLATIGLVGMHIAFPTIHLYAGEIFPTTVRSIGVGTASMLAKSGAMMAPFIVSFREYNPIIPPIIFGIFSALAAFFAMLLPETRGRPLPATIEDVENRGKKSNN